MWTFNGASKIISKHGCSHCQWRHSLWHQLCAIAILFWMTILSCLLKALLMDRWQRDTHDSYSMVFISTPWKICEPNSHGSKKCPKIETKPLHDGKHPMTFKTTLLQACHHQIPLQIDHWTTWDQDARCSPHLCYTCSNLTALLWIFQQLLYVQTHSSHLLLGESVKISSGVLSNVTSSFKAKTAI